MHITGINHGTEVGRPVLVICDGHAPVTAVPRPPVTTPLPGAWTLQAPLNHIGTFTVFIPVALRRSNIALAEPKKALYV